MHTATATLQHVGLDYGLVWITVAVGLLCWLSHTLTYTPIHTHVHPHIHPLIQTHLHTHPPTQAHKHTHVRTLKHPRIHTHPPRIHTHTHVHSPTHAHTHSYTCTCSRTYTPHPQVRVGDEKCPVHPEGRAQIVLLDNGVAQVQRTRNATTARIAMCCRALCSAMKRMCWTIQGAILNSHRCTRCAQCVSVHLNCPVILWVGFRVYVCICFYNYMSEGYY